MRQLLHLTFACLLPAFAAKAKNRAPAQSPFVPVSFEKIVLPIKPPESIMFLRNRNGAGQDAMSMNYYLDENVIRNRVIPYDLYRELKSKLEATVFKLAEKDSGQMCSNRVTWVVSRQKGTPKQITPYCLDGPSGAAANFAKWYNEAKRDLGL